MIKVTKRVQLPSEGDVFAVPLADGSFGITQLAHLWRSGNTASPTYLLFPARFSKLSDAEEALPRLDLSAPPYASTSDGEEIVKRRWPRIGNRPIAYDGIIQLTSELGEWGWWRAAERGYLEMFLGAMHAVVPLYKLFATDRERMALAPVPSGQVEGSGEASLRARNGADAELLRLMAQRGDRADAVRPVRHFLLLPRTGEVPPKLRELGDVEVNDGVICVCQRLRRSEIAESADRVRTAAADAGLDYDGWEAGIIRS